MGKGLTIHLGLRVLWQEILVGYKYVSIYLGKDSGLSAGLIVSLEVSEVTKVYNGHK